MKKIKIGILSGVLALTALTSCKKLELYPYNTIELSQGFKTVSDAQKWNTGLYSAFRGRIYAGYLVPQEVQADMLNASADYGNRNGNPHRWGDSFLAADQAGIWNAYYSAIANVNTMIKGFETITPANATETTQLNKYKGDARLIRAHYYHQLILRFAKAYNPTTAGNDLGVPLVLEFDVTALPARASVKAVYDQIIADITAAKALLSAAPGAQGSNVFNVDVATALEARVRLYMQDFTGAYTAANSLITANKYPLYNTPAGLKTYWHNDGKQEDIMQVLSNDAEVAPTNVIFLGLNGPQGWFTPDFIPTQTAVNMFEDADFRKGAYLDRKLVQIQGAQYPNLYLVNKYPGNPALLAGAVYTNYRHSPKAYRIAEQYLIAAEASATTNPANSLAALNALRVARGLTALSGLSGAALVQEVRAERTRELAFEGYRLWDLKRWGLGFNGRPAQISGPIVVGPNFDQLVIDAANPKFTWGIPPTELLINKNLVQNPGW